MENAAFPSLLQELYKSFPIDASIAIADSSQFIYYEPSQSIDLKIKPGDFLKEGTATLKAVQARQKVTQIVDRDLYGIPYYGLSIPIISNEAILYCFTAIFPLPFSVTKPSLQSHSFLIGKVDDRWIPIPHEKIVYIHSKDGKTWLHTKDGQYLNKFNLTELEGVLPNNQFIRCHRAYMVNIGKIEEIQPHFHSTFLLVMKSFEKIQVPVSQKYASHFREYMGF
ncbi:LytTR family DNA-binding domain-containing protein [Ammoniphilus resinae]|uniref:DNA-binding LytR/AlgR family response regulator n=1 Tax=Ammoniphilus resinae TaxID=861532 RepID=A0ABS4GN13_9BACL|nr:LytTR family DNA-binding domain-containing protein [Ammoniphilus resinae]MBP1931629.1 DNA-binding LytR/AlgR family response regulator [Ammoniphilus resinae]